MAVGMQLHLQVDNQKAIFGPNDIIKGTGSLITPGNIQVSEVRVDLTGTSTYGFSPYLIYGDEHALEQSLLRHE